MGEKHICKHLCFLLLLCLLYRILQKSMECNIKDRTERHDLVSQPNAQNGIIVLDLRRKIQEQT